MKLIASALLAASVAFWPLPQGSTGCVSQVDYGKASMPTQELLTKLRALKKG